jgi:hypothetical protein
MKLYKYFLILIAIIFYFNNFYPYTYKSQSQDSLILAPEVAVPPVIDGLEDDSCWKNVPWQSIDQVWFPFPFDTVPYEDYSGKFKVVWSSTANLLYFLIEITDDEFVDGFDPDSNNGAIYDFDICEVFIDEDASGGLHMYDNGEQNAENAFAYHIYAPFPVEGEVSTNLYVSDMASTPVNYASHFPEFVLKRITKNIARWEFSLIVYNDTYEENNREAARVELSAGKIMGLSLAYCDNDDPNENPKRRDNMFGSVWEPEPRNLHWQNADYFGRIKLVSALSTGIGEEHSSRMDKTFYLQQNFPNPFNPTTTIKYSTPFVETHRDASVQLIVYDVLGRKIATLVNEEKSAGTYEVTWNAVNLQSGVYFYQLKAGNYTATKKLLLLK